MLGSTGCVQLVEVMNEWCTTGGTPPAPLFKEMLHPSREYLTTIPACDVTTVCALPRETECVL